MSRWRLPEVGMIYFVIIASMLAGLAAAYGRELEGGRSPDRGWWLRRLLILPMLAISAAAVIDLLDLSPTIAAFSAAMLSLGGYDVLRLLEARWLQRLALIQGPESGEAEAPR